MKTYELATSEVADEQKTITIRETVSVEKEERITVAQLKEQHARKLEEIVRIQEEADAIVDKLNDIKGQNLGIAVDKVPTKIKK